MLEGEIEFKSPSRGVIRNFTAEAKPEWKISTLTRSTLKRSSEPGLITGDLILRIESSPSWGMNNGEPGSVEGEVEGRDSSRRF